LPAPAGAGVPMIGEPQNAIIADENFIGITDFTANAFNEIAGHNGHHKPTFVQAEEDFAPVYATENSELYFQETPAPLPSTTDIEATSQVSNLEQVQAPELEFPAGQSRKAEVERFSGSEASMRVAQPEGFTHQEMPSPENEVYAAEPPNQQLSYVSDNHLSDFLYLVVDEKKKRFSPKLLLGIVAVALLAGLAAGYIFIYKPLFAATENSATAKAGLPVSDDNGAAKTPPSTPEGSAQATTAKPTDSKAVQADAKKAEEAKTVAANSDVDTKPAETGQFALQAGVFSTEANAGKLVDQLKRAGIPAYVAASKGNKFRVLVGKFASTSEAQKYIAQAQARANTAGIRLELFASEINP
jgi:cell division septation protein DedD